MFYINKCVYHIIRTSVEDWNSVNDTLLCPQLMYTTMVYCMIPTENDLFKEYELYNENELFHIFHNQKMICC